MTGFTGSVAVVTGAGSGIGRACALRLAARGARVALLDVDGAAARQTLAMIRTDGGDGRAAAVDVRDDTAVAAVIKEVSEHLGAPRVLVNAAGIALRKNLLSTSVAEWGEVLAVNLTGYFILLRNVVPVIAASGGGAVVQVASITALAGYGYPAYTAAKGGVLALTRQLALELAPQRIRVNSVSPGVIETGLNRTALSDEAVRQRKLARIPWRRLGTPEDVARAVEYLAGPDADFVTGTDVVVDGGMTSGICWD